MIVIAGKNNIAVKAVDYLIHHATKDIAVICNQTDDGVDTWQRSLLNYAKSNGIKIINLKQAYAESEVFISLEFDKIVKPDMFKKARAYNIHFSNLPKYKGMYTSIFPILNGENSGGVTLHEIDAGIDTGPIIDQIIFPINSSFRARDLYREYLNYSFELFIKNLIPIISGVYSTRVQQWQESSYYSKNSVKFPSIFIDLNQTAANIIRQIYAYSFREYQMPVVRGKRIAEALVLESRSLKKPGTLLSQNENSLIISTIDFDLQLFYDRVEWISRFSNCNVIKARSLLNNLAGVNDRNHMGWSPLIVAAYSGNHEVVKFLLDSGALINDENYNGTSVLMYAKDYALQARDKTSFDRLVKVGSDIEKRDFYGKSLKDYLQLADIDFLGI
jgi:methionyl-tRNA formyltransferase